MDFRTQSGKLPTDERDGGVAPDDPTMTRMANLVRYMRSMPIYLNKWPEAMLCFGLTKEGMLCCSFFMPLVQFEEISEKQLFDMIDKETDMLLFSAATKFPPTNKAAQAHIKNILSKPKEELDNIFNYLHLNGWWLRKDEVK